MKWAERVAYRDVICTIILLGKLKESLWEYGCKWEDNTEMDPKEIACCYFEWIQDRAHWHALVNAAVSPRISCRAGEFVDQRRGLPPRGRFCPWSLWDSAQSRSHDICSFPQAVLNHTDSVEAGCKEVPCFYQLLKFGCDRFIFENSMAETGFGARNFTHRGQWEGVKALPPRANKSPAAGSPGRPAVHNSSRAWCKHIHSDVTASGVSKSFPTARRRRCFLLLLFHLP
jgi:hypothetical protein